MRRQSGSERGAHALPSFRRCLSAALAVWIAVFSIGIHGVHTCSLHQSGLPQSPGKAFSDILSPGCHAACACPLLRYAEAASDGAAATSPIVVTRLNCDESCPACRYLAQPQMPPAIAAPLMAGGYASDAVPDAPKIAFVSSPAYSADIPRAPPIALV